MIKVRNIAAVALGCLALAQSAFAVPVTWVDWTSADAVSASGNAGAIGVAFSGVINPSAQTSGGTNYWASSPTTYTSNPEVDNPPPDSDIVRLTGGANTGTQTITFSEAVTNPVMAILSLGQPGAEISYVFGDEEFNVLNSGVNGIWGGCATCLFESSGNVLAGTEGNGIIQFEGTFTSIDWTIPVAEFWHGFTIAIPGESQVPEPATVLLIGFGLTGIGLARRRKYSV